MPVGILKSVGVGGANERRDVKIVQTHLNLYGAWKEKVAALKIDGYARKKTIYAIKEFQRQAVGMTRPDSRIDPNGQTFRILTMYLDSTDQKTVENAALNNTTLLTKFKVTRSKILAAAGLGAYTVSYKSDIKQKDQIVSNYAKLVIKLALKESGMTKAVITSTLRSPKEQATIMLRNAKKDLSEQFRLYGRHGDTILNLYKKNKTKTDSELIKLMEDKILDLEKEGALVSKHCVSITNYKKKNIIDIGVNSTRKADKSFNQKKFTNALKNLAKEGYIKKFIDETGKSNQCWHIEVTPDIKAIANYCKNSVLNQTKIISG